MSNTVRLYTPAEAAAVSGLALKTVNNVIDKGIIKIAKPDPGSRPGTRRYLTRHHILCLRLEHGLAGRLPIDRRQAVFRAVETTPDARLIKADDILLVDVDAVRKDVDARMRDLEEAEKLIHSDKDTLGGEPVFKGTRIPVLGVVAMLESGAKIADLLSGYPPLDERKLELARLWAAAHPRRGRPKRLADFGFKLIETKRQSLPGDPLETSPAEGG